MKRSVLGWNMNKSAWLICLLCFLICCGPKQAGAKKIIQDGVEADFNHLEAYITKGELNSLNLEDTFTIDTEKDVSPLLSQILEKSAEYCKKLEQVSLHFVCHEEIKEYIYFVEYALNFIDNTYVYDYQLIRNGKSVSEQRILIEENGLKKNEKNVELKTKRFKHKFVIFGPIGLLGKNQQSQYKYKIQKEKKYKGNKCYIIEIVPKPNERTNYLFGKVWVRQSDFSIMKIEWEQTSMKDFERVEKEAKKMGARAQITFVSEYAFEKNGIRFPSRYNVKEEYIHPNWGKEKKSEITVVYKKYKFFIVDTEVKIK